MKIDKLIDAIGEIDENKIINAKVIPCKIKRISFRRAVAMVAAIVFFNVLPEDIAMLEWRG